MNSYLNRLLHHLLLLRCLLLHQLFLHRFLLRQPTLGEQRHCGESNDSSQLSLDYRHLCDYTGDSDSYLSPRPRQREAPLREEPVLFIELVGSRK